MEIILKISTSKKLAVLLFLISTISSLTAQDINGKDFYREDQFYFGSSYFIQTEQVTDFKQNGFSGNFQFGFIRDIPLNKTSTNALGIGVGFERNLFTSNIQPLEVDGEMQADVALDAEKRLTHFPFTSLRHNANILIFADLQSANIAYKLLHKMADAEAVGPILVGFKQAVNVCQMNASINEIVHMCAITAAQAKKIKDSNSAQTSH